ncbi:hypothetical protein K2173_027369 [Erythroxylum novogranatense]|uniref:Uncharacterized protein n=1 Tax=Erythroxylum novogranatense TaxID=1862640 RepID=A0AAV8TYT2_9ROSI|nr:hypothetical protein K2173_027369 [Erythroxylum novogranatense]
MSMPWLDPTGRSIVEWATGEPGDPLRISLWLIKSFYVLDLLSCGVRLFNTSPFELVFSYFHNSNLRFVQLGSSEFWLVVSRVKF